jgi:hypothetical protein
MALEFQVNIDVQQPRSHDVDHGVMTVSTFVAGEARSVTVQVAADATTAGPFYGSEGNTSTASFYWVDDAGNESPSTVLEFALSDTIPPDQPGGLGVTVLREIPDDQVPPVEPII